MIQLFPAEKRHVQRMGWLDLYSAFSCNDFFDPWNTHFASLIALNEYVMQPGFGFNMHPHEDIEQVFLVTEGQLSHADSLGNEGVLSPGSVQSISAGYGYARYAYNKGTEPCRYLAAWFTPNALRLPPRYAGALFPADAGAPVPIVSGDAELLRIHHDYPPLAINCNATISLLRLNAAEYVESVGEWERLLIHVVKGTLQLNHDYIRKGGHARIAGKEKIRLAAEDHAEIMLISMWR